MPLRLSLVLLTLLNIPTLAAPPGVVKTDPQVGDKDLDPATAEIRITFDQPMSRGGHSVVGGGPNFPRLLRTRWTDEKTFVISVQLEPEHEYALSVNSHTFTGFRNRDGQPVPPHPITFRTARAGASPKPWTPPSLLEQNKDSIRELRLAIDLDYSYRDLRKVDWEKEFAAATPKLEAAKSPKEFAEEAANLLAKAGDIHVSLKAGDATIPSHRRSYTPNFNFRTLQKVVPNWKKNNDVVLSGLLDDGTRYLLIASWPGNNPIAIEPAYEILADAAEAQKPLIIDVRPNSGGDDSLAAQFAGCFIDKPVVFAKNNYRLDGRFTNVMERTLPPNKARPKFRGKLAVLTGPGAISSCESFLLMMKQVPGCQLFGLPSAGASGNPRPVELANGVTVFLSRWQDMRPDGTCFEGQGIAPDVTIRSEPKDFLTADPVLAAALAHLRSPER